MNDGLPAEWHGGIYPPGTPPPRDEEGLLTCSGCGETSRVVYHHELGMVDVSPEECPECDLPWGADDELEPEEPDPDRQYDTRYDY